MSLVDTKLQSVVYDHLKALPPKVIDHISPSQLGGCMRAHFYAIKHIPQTTPPSPGALLNFQMGFIFEELVTKALESSGIEFQDQQPIKDEELNVSGTLDFMLKDAETGEWEVIDTKTESILASKYRVRERKTFLQAHPEYEIQLGTYMLMLKRKGLKVSRGRFLVVVKDNGSMTEHFVVLNPELEQNILGRIETLNGYLKRNEVPPCSCEGWKVGYCGYGDEKTQIVNSTKKLVNSTCCGIDLIKGAV